MTTTRFSSRVTNLKSSPIRDILSVIEKPGMISFAGGLPASDSFPDLPTQVPKKYLQYGASEGEFELRTTICQLLKQRGLNCVPEQILILTGSQQGIDLAGKLFVDPGSRVAVETPTYLAALQVFEFYGAELAAMDINKLDTTYSLTYLNPTFQNPTGYCYDLTTRQNIAQTCEQTLVPLFEDDPYHDLIYDDVNRTPICSMLTKAPWIYQGSFSKSFAPGLRLGFMACSENLIPYLTRLKQAADLHSNRVSQYYVQGWLTDSNYQPRLTQLAQAYKSKRDHFALLLDLYFKDIAQWDIPTGGLFFWLKLKTEYQYDTNQLLEHALKNDVAFMPGEHFFPFHGHQNKGYIRLNFSNASKDNAQTGLKRLARLIKHSRLHYTR